MKVKYINQIPLADDKLSYEFKDDMVIASIKLDGEKEVKDTFDFRDLPDGVLDLVSYDEDGVPRDNIETDLPINPILYAERRNGELRVTLARWVDSIDEVETDWIDI